MSGLKAELKGWESQFRLENGRAPSKQDIKANPAVAEKYKQYAKSKSTIPTKPLHAPSPAVPLPSPSTLLEPSIFKTPTKPKPPRLSRPSSTTSASASASMSVPGSKSPTRPAAPTYVVANSPSKLRALAAAHSSHHSPNTPVFAPSNGPNLAGGGIAIVGSPKKYNPFHVGGDAPGDADAVMRDAPGSTSPKKAARNLFVDALLDGGEGRRQEERRKSFGVGSAGGGGGTTEARNIFRRGSSLSSGGGKGREGRGRNASREPSKDVAMADAYAASESEDDEVFGPSPIKPAAKNFTPLFLDDAARPAAASAKPKLFQGDIKHLRESLSASASSSATRPPTIRPPAKRLSTNTFDWDDVPSKKLATGTVAGGDGDDAEASASDFDSDDDAARGKGKGRGKGAKGKGKGKKAAAAAKGKKPPATVATLIAGKKTKPRRPKFSAVALAELDEVELGDDGFETRASIQRRQERGVFVLDLDEEDEEGEAEEMDAGGRKERVIIHPRRPYHRGGVDDEDGDEAGRSLRGSLYYHDSADLLHSQPSYSQPSHTDELEDDYAHGEHPPRPSTDLDIDIDASIPDELISVLSLRASPIKKTSLLRERDRDLVVKLLLEEPSAKQSKRTGLADLVDEGGRDSGEEGRGGGGEGEGGSDDDWASDADGWKDLGDGVMDGYDEKW